MKLAILLLASAQLWGACHRIGSTKNHYCPASTPPDPAADGADARAYIANWPSTHSCGDTIILDSGATYNTPTGSGYTFPFVLVARCPSNNRITIKSTRSEELPKGYTAQMTDIPRLAKIRVVSGIPNNPYAGMGVFGTNVSGYILDGLVFTTDPAISAVDHGYYAGAMLNLALDDVPFSQSPRYIDVRHVILTNGEEELYGPLYACQTFACALRSTSIGFGLYGRDMVIEDSAVYGYGGFYPSYNPTPLSITAATTATQTRITATGIATMLGLGARGDNACINPSDGTGWCSLSCDGTFGGAVGCAKVMIEGAPAGLEIVNGIKYAIYVDANTVALDNGDWYSKYTPANAAHVDTTGKPAWSGTASIRPTGTSITPVYNVVNGLVDNVKLVHNHFENADMTVFSTGGGEATSMGTVQAGSTDTSIVIRNATGPVQLGDVIVVEAPGFSKWCGPGGDSGTRSCYAGAVRTGKITAIGGTAPNYTFTVEANGPTGIDVAPTATTLMASINATDTSATLASTTGLNVGWVYILGPGPEEWVKVCGITGNTVSFGHTSCPNVDGRGFNGTKAASHSSGENLGTWAQWQGLLPTRLAYLRNDFLRDHRTYPTGKGPMELKSVNRSLIDGNVVHGSKFVNFFFEAKNQASGGNGHALNRPGPPHLGAPWTTFTNTSMSNNVYSGGARWAMLAADYEATTAWSENTWFENNVGVDILPGGNYFESGMVRNGGYRHNTIMSDGSGASNTSLVNGLPPDLQCWGSNGAIPTPYLDDYNKTETLIKDNLMPYGRGFVYSYGYQNCWPNMIDAVKGNTFLADGAPTSTDITTEWTGNNAATNLATLGMTGSCTFANWRQCALGPSSPFKGTATDGKDPGADILQVDDHINGWSEDAGLHHYEALTGTFDQTASAFQIGATHVVVKFSRFGAIGSCALKIYTDPSRKTLHADTNTIGRQACNRVGNLDDGGTVQFAVGINAPLTAATTYYYELTDGTRVMPGQFTTARTEPMGPVSIQLGDPTAADAYIEYAGTAAFSGAIQTQPVPFVSQVAMPTASFTGVRYYRWVKRDDSGRVLSVGPTAVAFR